MAAPVLQQDSNTSSNSATAAKPIVAVKPIPSWLVPIVGFGILIVLANTSLFKPITIILVGIIALWLMNG